MNTEMVHVISTAVLATSTVVLVGITVCYAWSTHGMLREMTRQGSIQAISAELSTLNSGGLSQSELGSKSTKRIEELIDELHVLTKKE